MANEQPQAAPEPLDGDALLDQYLEGVSQAEDTPKREKAPRKTAASGDPENKPDEDEQPEPDEEPGEADEEETGDTDAEDDAEDEDEDQSPDDDEKGRFVGQNGRVKLADGTVTTVAELVRGNLREADYTRKTQETGALHSELQARLADYAQQDQLVSIAIEVMASNIPPEPDPSLLQAGEGYDPIAYTSQKLLWENSTKQLQNLVHAREQMAAQQQVMQGTLLKKYALEQKDQLLMEMPELKDKTALDAFNSETLRNLGRYGKGATDLAQVYDAKIILMLKHLNHYWRIMADRKKARQKTQGAPVLAPSTRQSAQGKKARAKQADWETLRKTGSHGAGGEAALDRILDDLL